MLLFITLNILNNTSHEQVVTSNDGFEGTPTKDIPPIGWNNCSDGHSSVDTQPGFFNDHTPASEGQSYISIVTREINPPGTIETVWSNLLTPFEISKEYLLSFDLARSHEFYGTVGFTDYYFDNPCILQIIGFNGDCAAPQDSEMLWQSDVLNNYNWQTYIATFKPSKATFNNIAIRPNFIAPGVIKNSVVYIDNLKLIRNESGNVFIPNCFSPNGDGINDSFRIVGENIDHLELRIYNRWGNLVFETSDKNEAWTGRIKNSDCPTGEYCYLAIITFSNGEKMEKKGTLTLLK
jgi:gliding motility-associated-like protein